MSKKYKNLKKKVEEKIIINFSSAYSAVFKLD
jgi:hypothetical protein